TEVFQSGPRELLATYSAPCSHRYRNQQMCRPARAVDAGSRGLPTYPGALREQLEFQKACAADELFGRSLAVHLFLSKLRTGQTDSEMNFAAAGAWTATPQNFDQLTTRRLTTPHPLAEG